MSRKKKLPRSISERAPKCYLTALFATLLASIGCLSVACIATLSNLSNLSLAHLPVISLFLTAGVGLASFTLNCFLRTQPSTPLLPFGSFFKGRNDGDED
jgi:hypothetical protein